MYRLRVVAVLFSILATTGISVAQDFKQRFVGKSPCAPDIQSQLSDFSLRLDKTQDLTLLYRDLSTVKVMMIIEPQDSGDRCGVIRDAVQITHIAKNFELRCFDPHAPADVVIGTAIRKEGNTKPVTAIDSWRIDLKEKKFIETHDRVTCTNEGWDGDDDGSDLVDEAKKYAAHHKSGRFESEPLVSDNDAPQVRVEIRGELQRAKLTEGGLPRYPEEALKSKFGGRVGLHVVFDKGGAATKVEPISGHPVLAQAAVDAVKKWKYPPTLLDGQPVEVDTLVFFTFALPRQ